MSLAALVLASALAQASPAAIPAAPSRALAARRRGGLGSRRSSARARAVCPEAGRVRLRRRPGVVDRSPEPGARRLHGGVPPARIGVRGEVLPRVGYTVLFDAADTSLKDAYVGLRFAPRVELRLGQFKTPFGYEQAESDTKLLWVYNSYVVQALARGRDSRNLGALLTGRMTSPPCSA